MEKDRLLLCTSLCYSSSVLTVLVGDAITQLTKLPDRSVQCCVTSPPYWGLRDYGTAKWEGGDDACEHIGNERYYTEQTAATCSGDAFSDAGTANAERLKKGRWRNNGQCVHCGAVKTDAQLGLEKTPEAYVANMVQVFREVRRVLKDDGTCWINLGDSYSNIGKWGGSSGGKKSTSALGNIPRVRRGADCDPKRGQRAIGQPMHFAAGLKPKDLVGIPWMVAFALRADGWYLRQDIIWSKPNPMPEPVRDRCTKAHEYIFLLSKGPRYYFDGEAIAEPVAASTVARLSQDIDGQAGSDRVPGKTNGTMKAKPPRFGGAKYGDSTDDEHRTKSGNEYKDTGNGMRNKRSVWAVTTKPFRGAHFATFPPDLIRPCILAGTRKGDTVLDPFGGSGTTGMVALQLGRQATLIELNPDYVNLIEQRCVVPEPPAQADLFAYASTK
jgi:DNA modification methylase